MLPKRDASEDGLDEFRENLERPGGKRLNHSKLLRKV